MKNRITLLLFTIACLSYNGIQAQDFPGLDKSPMDMAIYRVDRNSAPIVRVLYSRPQLKGRTMATLAPAGKVWRTGANETTEITFYEDVNFGGKPISAGTYSLFTIPGEKEWTVVLNSDLNTWGAYAYNEGADVARVSVPAASDSESLEPFSIGFKKVSDGIHMIMGWDKTRVAVPITM